MDGVAPRQWRIRKGGLLREIVRENHTREVKDVPPEIIARIEALEAFAATVADQINRCNADILAARQDNADLTAKLKAVSDTLDKHWHPINEKAQVA